MFGAAPPQESRGRGREKVLPAWMKDQNLLEKASGTPIVDPIAASTPDICQDAEPRVASPIQPTAVSRGSSDSLPKNTNLPAETGDHSSDRSDTMATEGDEVKLSGESGGAIRGERVEAGRPVKPGNKRSRNSPRPSGDRSSNEKRGRRRSKPRDISPASSKRSQSGENKVGRSSGHTAHGVRERNDRRRHSTSRSDSLRPVDRKRPLRSVDNNRVSVESRTARKRQVSPRSGRSSRHSAERGGRAKYGTASPRNVSPRAGRRGISPDKIYDARRESSKKSTSRDRRGPPARRGSPYKSPGRNRRQSISPPPRATGDYRRYGSPEGRRENYYSDRRRVYNNQSSGRGHRLRSRSPEARRDTRGASPDRYRRGYRGASRQSDRRPTHRADSYPRRPKNPRSPSPTRPKDVSCSSICNLLMEARNSIKERRRDAISSAVPYFDEDEFRGEDWRGSPLEIDQYLDKFFAEFPNPTKVTKRITLELNPRHSFSVEFEPRKQSTITLYECKDGLITRAYIFKDDADFSRLETRMTLEDFAEDGYCGKDVIKYFKKKGMKSISELHYNDYKDDVKIADESEARPTGRGGR